LQIYSMAPLHPGLSKISTDTWFRNKTLLACYHFGAPEAAKYTTQFIDSYASFVNHAPIELTGEVQYLPRN